MKEENKLLTYVYDFAGIFVTAIIAILILFTFVLKTSIVNGQSMENTFYNGDKILISSYDYSVDYGDVVVISQPNLYEKVLIKRVIAVEGQTVSFDQTTNELLIDGEKIDEPYIKEDMKLIYSSMKQEISIPEGYVFVMGDNRNNSADSRDSNVGLIDKRYIIGQVFYKFGDSSFFEKDSFNG